MALIEAAGIVDATTMALSGRRVSAEDHLAQVERLRPVALALVDRYAAAAPEAIRSEAIVRFVGASLESGFGAKFTSQVRPLNHSAMWRTSGALGLLHPWRVQRGGVV